MRCRSLGRQTSVGALDHAARGVTGGGQLHRREMTERLAGIAAV